MNIEEKEALSDIEHSLKALNRVWDSLAQTVAIGNKESIKEALREVQKQKKEVKEKIKKLWVIGR